MGEFSFNEWIGWQLIGLDEGSITIKKDDTIKVYEIEEDYGGCCGYNELHVQMFDDVKRNPVIVDVKEDRDCMYDGDSLILTFFGENNKILGELTSFSYSGSGWGYGANVSIKCKNEPLIELTCW